LDESYSVFVFYYEKGLVEIILSEKPRENANACVGDERGEYKYFLTERCRENLHRGGS
jgi:hypothetical protein